MANITVSATIHSFMQAADAAAARAVLGGVVELATFGIDGGGSIISSGTLAMTKRFPAACTLTGWSIQATGATGTITVKFWYKATATSIPVVGDVINTTGIQLTTGTAVDSATLSDFSTTAFAAKSLMRAAFTTDGTATDLNVVLYGTIP